MAMRSAAGLRNAMMDAVTTFVGASPKLRFYNGAQPATGGTATTLLAECICNATFAPAASGGVLTLNAVASDASADATGTVTWARLVKTDGTTHIADFTVGTSGTDIIVATTSFVLGAVISVSSFTLTDGNP